MRRLILKNLHHRLRQFGQGMTEVILILAAVGIGGIFVYTQFGDVLRHQTAASALALAGRGDTGQTAAAREIAVTASAGASRSVGNFAGSGAYGGGSGPDGSYGGGAFGLGGSGSGSGGSGSSGAYSSGSGSGSGGSASGYGGGMPGGAGFGLGVWPPPAPAIVITEALYAAQQANKYKKDTDPLLHKEVQELIEFSPTLETDIAKLEAEGWNFRFTDKPGSYVLFDRKIVFVTNKGDEIRVVRGLSHEVSHALNGNHYDYSSKEAYVQSRLEDEGDALMKNIQVQREISVNGKQDIGVGCSFPPCYGLGGRYTAIYDQYLDDGDAAAARKAIAEKWAEERAGLLVNGNFMTYREYCEAAWEDHVRRPRSSPQPQRSQSKNPVKP